MFVVRTGPDFRAAAPVPAAPGLKQGARYLVSYLGTMATQDGVDYFPRAASATWCTSADAPTRTRPDRQRSLLDDLKLLATELGIADRVTFTGAGVRRGPAHLAGHPDVSCLRPAQSAERSIDHEQDDGVHGDGGNPSSRSA